MFVTGYTRGDLKLWDAYTSLLHAEKDAHDLGVTCCCFAPQFIVSKFSSFVTTAVEIHLKIKYETSAAFIGFLRQGKWDFYLSSHIFHVNGAGKLSQIFRTTDSYSK